MLSWNAVAVMALLSAEPSILSPPLVADQTPAKNAIWISPLAGELGRASIGYERALGKGASIHVELMGGFDVGDMTETTAGQRSVFNSGMGLVSAGVRAFPFGEAPFGPWVGGQVGAGLGVASMSLSTPDQTLFEMRSTAFLGEGELQAGCTLALWKGLSVNGSLGLRGRYLRFLEGMAGDQLSLGVSTSLGVGYAF